MSKSMLRTAALSLLIAGLGVGVTRAADFSKDQAAAFGKSVAKTIYDGDVAGYAELWDSDAFLDRVTSRVNAPDDFKEGFTKGVKQAFARQFVQQLSQAIGTTGSVRLLSVRTVDGEQRPLLRLVTANGLNYNELILGAGPDGKPLINDVYVYASGETLSQTLRSIYIKSVMQQGQNKNPMPKDLEATMRLNELLKAGDFQKAVDAYQALPPELQKQKLVQIYYLQAASKVDNDVYLKALEEYSKLFKGDASADLLAIDALFLTKKWDQLSTVLDRIEKQVGRDPYLDVFRANAAIQRGEAASGVQIAEAGLKDEPTLFALLDVLLTQALADKDYQAVKKYALQLERTNPRFHFGDLRKVPVFAPFVESPEYDQWVKERKQIIATPADAG